jgi:hypothetical protein
MLAQNSVCPADQALATVLRVRREAPSFASVPSGKDESPDKQENPHGRKVIVDRTASCVG